MKHSREKIRPRMMCASSNGNPCLMIDMHFNIANAYDETDISTLYKELSSLVQHILKHNVKIISVNMNTQIGKDENDKIQLTRLVKQIGEYLLTFHSRTG